MVDVTHDRDDGRTSFPVLRFALVLAKLSMVYLLALGALGLMTARIGIVSALLWDVGPVVEETSVEVVSPFIWVPRWVEMMIQRLWITPV
jgi:hypothetical protein